MLDESIFAQNHGITKTAAMWFPQACVYWTLSLSGVHTNPDELIRCKLLRANLWVTQVRSFR